MSAHNKLMGSKGSKWGIKDDLLGQPACSTPKAAVTPSEQQPYTDLLQCWGSGRDVAETADEVGTKKEREMGDGTRTERRTPTFE